MNCFLIAAAGLCIADVAGAVSTSRRAVSSEEQKYLRANLQPFPMV
ncbi:hypothetical protein BVRB_7g161050 isoform C [Beta vulgaris subsp. vulgaris]|nr:hypothetical protein BVRB_7g161050 isoform C [Beta vulgaris subsp. vulgaris]